MVRLIELFKLPGGPPAMARAEAVKLTLRAALALRLKTSGDPTARTAAVRSQIEQIDRRAARRTLAFPQLFLQRSLKIINARNQRLRLLTISSPFDCLREPCARLTSGRCRGIFLMERPFHLGIWLQ